MSLFNDYIDGVPVKISEKFKPPPKVELPYSVIECPSRAQYVLDNAQYYFKFEENVLSKIAEIKRAKEKIRNERKHRIQLFEEAKQKRLDIIAAAEAEEKLKLLNVSEVSYPSTEEINDIPLDVIKAEKQNFPSVSDDSTLQEPTTSVDTKETVFQANGSNLNMENVLQPIQILPNIYNTNLLDDPDPLQEFRITAAPGNQPYNQLYAKNYDQLTFQHFENDTSSPFDNAELKSLNDMEMLAQVLQREKSQNTDCPNNTYSDLAYQAGSNCPNMPLANAYMQQPIFDQPIVSHTAYNSPQHYHATNGYFMSNTTDNLPSNNMYLPNYFYSSNLYSQDQTYYSSPSIPLQNPEETSILSHQQEPSLSVNEQNIQVSSATAPSLGELPIVSHTEQYPIANNAYHHYYSKQDTYESYTPKSRNESVPSINQSTMAYNTESMSYKSDYSMVNKLEDSSNSEETKSFNLKSNSVSDKIRELYDEISEMKLQTKDIYAQADRPYNAGKPRLSSNLDNKLAGPSYKAEHQSKKTNLERLPDPYETLPLPIQDMCRNIHHMGFPLDRVARVYKIVGDNDKKIIDILILIGQLMDLGFSESKVTNALSKHGYDRDKALDELLT